MHPEMMRALAQARSADLHRAAESRRRHPRAATAERPLRRHRRS